VPALGKMLVILGVVLVVVGLGFMFADKIPYIGRLPGGHLYQKREVQLLLPPRHMHHHQHHSDDTLFNLQKVTSIWSIWSIWSVWSGLFVFET
jgi:hypothetical protein